jgi:hypothetical protein
MACRESEADHVLLRVPVCLAQFFNPCSQGMEELSFVNHLTYLENIFKEHHEQISCERGHYFKGLFAL